MTGRIPPKARSVLDPARPSPDWTPAPSYPPPLPHEPPTDPNLRLEMRQDFQRRKSRRRSTAASIAAAVAALGGLGSYGVKRASEADEHTIEARVRMEESFRQHVDREAEHHADVKRDVEQLQKGQRRSERTQAVIKAMLDMELDTHKVPRSRRPTEDDVEPAEPTP
jgi:hypothetical protein